VVLLVHGTGTTAAESWPNGFGRALPLAGFDWCMVQLPERALADIQVSSEYVVAAVRKLALNGRGVDLIGHSQGAVEIRWAVRFWPDVRADVEDLITLAGANNGVWSADAACSLGHCAPPVWQMRVGAALEAALNRIPAPPGPSYTAIYSSTDELIQPTSSGAFAGASNVLIQNVCVGRWVEHAWELFDAASMAIALDALTHPGPANPARIPNSVCAQTTGPGVDLTTAMQSSATLGMNASAAILTGPTATSEPPLRPYALAG
jgi:pimeloyl-ACP methyl ester carboxylesterase